MNSSLHVPTTQSMLRGKCDARIVCGKGEDSISFDVYSNILSASSHYFKMLFRLTNTEPDYQQVIERTLPFIDPEIFEALLLRFEDVTGCQGVYICSIRPREEVDTGHHCKEQSSSDQVEIFPSSTLREPNVSRARRFAEKERGRVTTAKVLKLANYFDLAEVKVSIMEDIFRNCKLEIESGCVEPSAYWENHPDEVSTVLAFLYIYIAEAKVDRQITKTVVDILDPIRALSPLLEQQEIAILLKRKRSLRYFITLLQVESWIRGGPRARNFDVGSDLTSKHPLPAVKQDVDTEMQLQARP